MSRNDKLHKLGNAVREWRGRYDARKKRWLVPPKESARERVIRWLTDLGLDVLPSLAFLAKVKTEREFNAWIAAQ